MEAIKKSPI